MARQSLQLWPGFKLDVQNDGFFVDSMLPVSDEKWTFLDADGHGHFWHPNKDNHYPTLRWVQLPCSMGHGNDCDAEGYHECLLCAERISPGTRTPQREWVQGMTTYTLTVGDAVYSIGPEQWDELQAAMKATVDTLLADFCIGRNFS